MKRKSDLDIQVLHVDDNDFDAVALRRAFGKLNIPYPVRRAKDGLDALEKLHLNLEQTSKSMTQTVIILDINMPRMNGHEFLNELRDDPILRQIPVFVLSTSDQPIDVQRAYKQNVAGYLVKPFASGNYLEQIRCWAEYLSIIELPEVDGQPNVG